MHGIAIISCKAVVYYVAVLCIELLNCYDMTCIFGI